MNKQRAQAEKLVYEVMDQLDPTEQNSNYYKQKFAKMNDKEFQKFVEQDIAFKFQHKAFEIEPTMKHIENAANKLNIPLLEEVNLPGLYSENGVPVKSKEALVVYIPLRKMKQFITKKNSMSTDISKRDMKGGLLLSDDKNGLTSDREFESLALMGMDDTMSELSRHRADAMGAKGEFYNIINTKGMVRLEEVPISPEDSLAKNLLNVYLLGSHLNSNLINTDYYLQSTINNKQKKIERES